MKKPNFLSKMFWMVAVLSATATVFNSCGNGEDDPTPKPTVAGTYNGVLEVEVLFPPSGEIESVPNTNIVIAAESGGTYTLRVLNFAFFGIELGDLNVTGVSASEENGVVTLTKEGSSEGPDVPLDLGIGNPITLHTFIYLNSATVENGKLTLDLSVTATSDEVEEELPVANVSFTGEK